MLICILWCDFRLLWPPENILKSHHRPLGFCLQKYILKPLNKVLHTLIGQKAANCKASKIALLLSNPELSISLSYIREIWMQAATRHFFYQQTWIICCFAALWPTKVYSATFDRSNPYLIGLGKKNGVAALLSHIMRTWVTLKSYHKMVIDWEWVPLRICQN